jgi:DNA-binding response OmpR family regulator
MPEKDLIPKIILIVDDEPVILEMMKYQLEYEGFAVITEKSGHAVKDIVQNTKLAAVLLDLGLPDMDGFEVLKNIKMVKPLLAVIMVTGNHEEEEARKAFDLGAWDYVTKPIDFNYLKNILRMQAPE